MKTIYSKFEARIPVAWISEVTGGIFFAVSGSDEAIYIDPDGKASIANEKFFDLGKVSSRIPIYKGDDVKLEF